MSRSASVLYCFVNILPIKVYLTTLPNFSNVFMPSNVIFLTDGFKTGLGVSALSNTPFAYVFLGISIILSFKDFLKLILG